MLNRRDGCCNSNTLQRMHSILMFIYSFLLWIFCIVYIPYLFFYSCKRSDNKIVRSKFGLISYPKLEQHARVIWIHAASVGETKVALSFIYYLNKARPGYTFLLTSTSYNVIPFLASQKTIVDSWRIKLVQQFLPIDLAFFIKKFLHHYQPICGLFIESELWLNTIKISASYTKLSLISARMSDKSYKFWKKFSVLIRPILQSFHSIMAQSTKDQQKFNAFGVKSEVMGNLKFCNISNSDTAMAPLREDNQILFASTHERDVEFLKPVVRHFQYISADYNNLRFIDAPRYLQDIKNHLNWCDHVVDEFGVMDYWYSTSKIIFIGGSCGAYGGHNPLEAAVFGRMIICGPDMSNYSQICSQMLESEAIVQVYNAYDLIDAIERGLKNEGMYEKYSANSRDFVLRNKKQVLDGYIDKVLAFL